MASAAAVLVSVASEVAACKETLPDFFSGYFEGKEAAESAATSAGTSCVVKPTFIYGGDEFGLLPPRVAAFYGSGVEELLSLPPFTFAAGKLPEGGPAGLLKVALRPPVSVDAVAGACAAAAMGEASGVLDGTAAIKQVGYRNLFMCHCNFIHPYM